MALPAMPMLWKKLVETIWNPIIGKKTNAMRMPSAASRMSSASEVKSDTDTRGRHSPMRNPNVMTAVAPIAVSFSTRNTRSNCRAPKL